MCPRRLSKSPFLLTNLKADLSVPVKQLAATLALPPVLSAKEDQAR